MGLINFYELNTIYGYKSIELHHDNLVSFSRPVDCLVISAYKGSYVPVRGSLIHALHEEGVEIKTLSKNPEFDLRDSMDLWLSKEIKNNFFKRMKIIRNL